MQLPSSERLEYLKLAAETLLVLLVVPILLMELLRNPSAAIGKIVGRVH